jgi:hypothetical protein
VNFLTICHSVSDEIDEQSIHHEKGRWNLSFQAEHIGKKSATVESTVDIKDLPSETYLFIIGEIQVLRSE